MNKTDKLKRANKILMVVIGICCVAIVVLVVLLLNKSNNNVVPENDTAIEDEIEDTESDSWAQSEYTEMIEISTPYCILNYPVDWKDYLKYDGKEENGVFTEKFYCCIKGQEIEMFHVYFNAPEVGTLLGYLTVDGEKVAFSVQTSTFKPDNSWTAEEKSIYYSMTEGINEVIQSVMSSDNYLEH